MPPMVAPQTAKAIPRSLPWKLAFTSESVVGHVALTGQILNLEDAYTHPAGAPFTINRSFDDIFTEAYAGTDVAIKSIANAAGDQKTLIVTPAAPLSAGEYKVEWHAVSVDTHTSEGAYQFKVSQ